MSNQQRFGEAVAYYMIAGGNLHQAWTELKPLLLMALPAPLGGPVAAAVAKMDEMAEKEQKLSVDLFMNVLRSATAAKQAASETPPADPYSGR